MSWSSREKRALWMGALCLAFATLVVILIFAGVVGPGLWWTATGVSLVALSNAIVVGQSRKRRRREQVAPGEAE